jgi:glyoxylase-like metal-dependent hydrolase (beta-lactamase superfamily II)
LPDDEIYGIKIINEPGHGFGMKGFLFHDVLFCGDLVQTQKGVIYATPDPYNIDKATYIQFLKSIDMSNIDLICQGHGKPITVHPA